MYQVNCPVCGKPKNPVRYLCIKKISEKQWCGSCRAKEISSRKEIKELRAELANSLKDKFSGIGNPFWGKKHSEDAKAKMHAFDKSQCESYQSDEFREKMSKATLGRKCPMKGKSLFQFWKDTLPIEEAERKIAELHATRSAAASGCNNPMYGKPSPMGSGNGWSGWYKEWYFRSLRELSYVIKVLEVDQKQWVPAKNKISYKSWDGKQRTYIPDFLVENSLLIEVKPKMLWESVNVVCKKNAAIKYCKNNNLKYKLVEPDMLTHAEIKELHDSGMIKFIDRYEKKYQQWQNQKNLI